MRPSRRPERQASSPADLLLGALCVGAVVVVVCAFGCLLVDVVRYGIPRLSWSFLTEGPRDAGRAGGIGTILVSTTLVLVTCLTFALPIGIGAGAWLAEIAPPGSRVTRSVRCSLDLLATVPSILFGLFGMVFFCETLGMGFSILAGGCTLATMILPIVVQTTYEGFRSAPNRLRLAAAALGLRKVTTLRHLLLPAAAHGVVVGLLLGIGRALAETAALLFTSGYVTRMPSSLFDSGRTLSVHIYDVSMNVPGASSAAHASAFVLLTSLLIVNLVARSLATRWLRTQRTTAEVEVLP